MLAEIANLGELEKRERLKWAFRFRRRLITGLIVIYALAVLFKLVNPLLAVLAFYLVYFGVNELRD